MSDVVIIAKFKGIEEVDGGNFKDKLNANLVFGNKFGVQHDVKVKMAEESGGVFQNDNLGAIFDKLNEELGTDMKVPEEITKETLEEALAPAIGENVEVLKLKGTAQEDGSSFTYYSFIKTGGGFQFATAKIRDLVDRYPELKQPGKTFVADLEGLVPDILDVIFKNNNDVSPTTPPKGSDTLNGVIKILGNVLKKDGSDFAKTLMNNLGALYEKENKSFKDILHAVGVWSTNSTMAEKFNDKTTVLMLQSLINKNDRNHLPYGTVRLTFSVGGEDITYQTSSLRTSHYKTSRNLDFTTSYHPEDSSYLDFLDFLIPMDELGIVTEEQAQAIQKMNGHENILRKITEIIKDSGFKPELRMEQFKDDYYVTLNGFVKEENVPESSFLDKGTSNGNSSQQEDTIEIEDDSPFGGAEENEQPFGSTDETDNTNEAEEVSDFDEDDLPF